MIEKNGVKVKQFYGMSSAIAMEKHAGGVAEYRLYQHIVGLGKMLVLKMSSSPELAQFHVPGRVRVSAWRCPTAGTSP